MTHKDELLIKFRINKDFVITETECFSDDFLCTSSLTGSSLTELLHNDYLEAVSMKLSSLKEGEVFSDHVLIGRFEGCFHYQYMETVFDGESYVINFYPSSYLQEPEISAETEGLLNLTIESLGVFYRTDRFGNMIHFSSKIKKLLGYNPADLIGGNLRRDFFLSTDKYDKIKRTMLADGGLEDIEVALKHKNGNIVWLKVSSVGVYNEQGEYFGTAGFAKNITPQKNSVEELAHMKRLLELKQKELDSLTVSMKYRVESQVSRGRKEEESILYHARLAEMGEMVGSIAHQWRQPLSALMFIIEDIRDAYHFGELDVQYLDDAIDECMSYVKFMSETMDDFRNFFRPEPDKEQFNLTEKLIEVIKMQYGRFEIGAVNVDIECDMREVGGSVEDILYIEYGRGIKVFCDIKELDGGVVVYGYPNLFKQVIINLVNNSIDSIMEMRAKGQLGATEAGLISITIKVDERKVSVHIKDNGTGIDERIMDKIFQPEYTTKPKNKGTGIGLHMAKSIVEKSLNGKINAGNSDTGAVFTITIPKVAYSVKPVPKKVKTLNKLANLPIFT